MKTILNTSTHKIEIDDSASIGVTGEIAIRKITTGAMQRRFTLNEEIAIDVGADDMCRTIKSRLLNAAYCDLGFQETIDGVSYIVSILATIDDPDDGLAKLVTDIPARITALLANGTDSESL